MWSEHLRSSGTYKDWSVNVTLWPNIGGPGWCPYIIGSSKPRLLCWVSFKGSKPSSTFPLFLDRTPTTWVLALTHILIFYPSTQKSFWAGMSRLPQHLFERISVTFYHPSWVYLLFNSFYLLQYKGSQILKGTWNIFCIKVPKIFPSQGENVTLCDNVGHDWN